MLTVDSTDGVSEVHEKYKEASQFFDLIRIPYLHYVIGILYNFCKDTDTLIVLSLLKED